MHVNVPLLENGAVFSKADIEAGKVAGEVISGLHRMLAFKKMDKISVHAVVYSALTVEQAHHVGMTTNVTNKLVKQTTTLCHVVLYRKVFLHNFHGSANAPETFYVSVKNKGAMNQKVRKFRAKFSEVSFPPNVHFNVLYKSHVYTHTTRQKCSELHDVPNFKADKTMFRDFKVAVDIACLPVSNYENFWKFAGKICRHNKVC